MTHHNDNRPRHYAVLDLEVVKDFERYNAYQRLDCNDPAILRYPFKRAVAAAVLTFGVDSSCTFEFGGLRSFVSDDEATLMSNLFDVLHLHPDHQLVTYGGLKHDLPIMWMAANEYDLRLPLQAIKGERGHGQWLHRDLAEEFRAGTYVHLSELLTRLRLPVKFAGSATAVHWLLTTGQLKELSAIAEADAISTGLLLLGQLRTTGDVASSKIAQATLLANVAATYPDAPYAEHLRRQAEQMMRGEMRRLEEVAAAQFAA